MIPGILIFLLSASLRNGFLPYANVLQQFFPVVVQFSYYVFCFLKFSKKNDSF